MSRKVLKPIDAPAGTDEDDVSQSGFGYGLETTLSNPVPLAKVVKNLARLLGGLHHVSIVEPAGLQLQQATVSSIAVCAGSGSDVLRGSSAELWVTGEMSHHDALAAAQSGKIVVTTFHSNTERKFLELRLRAMLEERITAEGGHKTVQVVVSKVDRDPFKVLDVGSL